MRCDECGIEHTDLREYAGDNYCPTCFAEHIAECVECGELFDRDDIVESAAGEFYCQSCYDAEYRRCARCGCEVIADEALTGDDSVYCEECFNRHYFRCHHCRETYTRNQFYHTPNNDTCCHDCFYERYNCCEGCGDTFYLEDLRETSNGYYCCNCNGPWNEWEPGTFSGTEDYVVMPSTRKFGVEIETNRCEGFESLRDNTIWGCKPDCSISGLEFVTPIMYGDAGLAEICRFCKQGRDKGWRTNNECGLHVHLDARDETPKQLRSIALAYTKTYELWRRLVEPRRHSNSMCGRPQCSQADIIGIDARGVTDWDYFVGAQDRFEFVNWRAYLVHGSIEIRLHHGSLDDVEICNWVRVHAKFIDAVADMSVAEVIRKFSGTHNSQFVALTEIIGDGLADYYSNKADEYGFAVHPTPAPVEAPTRRSTPIPTQYEIPAQVGERRILTDNEVMDRARDWTLNDIMRVADSEEVPQTHNMTWHVTELDEDED